MIGPPLPHASPKRKIQFSLGIIVEHFEQLPCSGHGRRRLSDLRRRPPRRTRRCSSILLQGTRLSAFIYHFVSNLSVFLFFFSLSIFGGVDSLMCRRATHSTRAWRRSRRRSRRRWRLSASYTRRSAGGCGMNTSDGAARLG